MNRFLIIPNNCSYLVQFHKTRAGVAEKLSTLIRGIMDFRNTVRAPAINTHDNESVQVLVAVDSDSPLARV